MAPDLTGRQTGTVPKNKPRNSGSQSRRFAVEPYHQLCSLDQEQMSDIGSRSSTRKKRSTSRSEIEADCLRHELEKSRSSEMTFQVENGEGCSQDNLCNRTIAPDQKQVANKLDQIQKYIQQTTALMSSLKASDSPSARNQVEKFSVILEDLKDSESKLIRLLDRMDNTKIKMNNILMDAEEAQGNGNIEVDDLELTRRSEESRKKLEILQQRKHELLKLQEKAKKQLKEAQAEQSRLVARASSLNQELGASKVADLNFQQLSQRLKAVQQIYKTNNQIADALNENLTNNTDESNHPEEDQRETSDTETDFQVVSDKMEKLDAMKAQLSQIQKMMAQISGEDIDGVSCGRESGDYIREVKSNSQTSSCIDDEQNGEDTGLNAVKLEEAKSKLSQLTQILEFVQAAQNSTGLSSSSIQLLSNLLNEETTSSTQSLCPSDTNKSTQKNRQEISMQTMQSMTKELEETTAAMKEERDRLLAVRQELQDIAKKLPVGKYEPGSLCPDDDSETEPPRLKPASLESSTRAFEAEKSQNYSDGSLYVNKSQCRNKQRGTWESSLTVTNSVDQERRTKNGSRSEASNQSSRGSSRTNSRNFGRENERWTSSPSVSYCNGRQNALVETQNQLDVCGNLCEIMLSESLQRMTRSTDIPLQEMFNQHQQLTRTVAQCTQLLWLQQKQILELRNSFMFMCGSLSGYPHPTAMNQIHLNGPPSFNPLNSAFTIANQVPISSAQQQQQNFLHAANPNAKLNMKRSADAQNVQVPQSEYLEQCIQQANQASMLFPEDFGFDARSGNFNRFYAPVSSGNQNIQLNVNPGLNNSGPNGVNTMVPEDSRALNNQVPPGNRANNYWDNFRSYSRQNLLSSTKSNEDSETSRRCAGTLGQERPPRDPPFPHFLQNNQSSSGPPQQSPQNPGNSELVANEQFLVIPSQNTCSTSHAQITRSRSVEPQSNRNSGKNESRHNDGDSRNLHLSSKNEGWGGVRPRNTDFTSDIRSVKNDVSQSVRNSDNFNSSRNFGHSSRDVDHEETPQGNNKKRLERDRRRNEVTRNLNNRVYHNTNLWDNIYSEVSNFIRANESRPDFLHHLFSGLQLVTTDNLRQRTLLTIQEAVSANNVSERQSNISGGNVNNAENRKNVRENRSNLNVNQAEDPSRIDELFFHLRENQNTIRQNIGMSSYMLGGNLENPNISNIRDLGSSRNNLESEGLRDLRTYFEANLCNFGHNSTLENPNLSNIRENLTRRDAGTSDFDNPRPKNVFLSIFDNAGELRRRNQEPSSEPSFESPYGNLGLRNDWLAHEFSNNRQNIRDTNNEYGVENNCEGAVGGRLPYQNGTSPSGLRLLDAGDTYNQGQFAGNGNDSGIDLNFSNEERSRSLTERADTSDRSAKPRKNGNEAVENGAALVLPEWERNTASASSFNSSGINSRKEANTSFISVNDSFFNSSSFQQSDNGDLAEADQSRNEEISSAESHCGFSTRVGENALYDPDQNVPPSEHNFASQNIPEAERNFTEYDNRENDDSLDGVYPVQPEGNPNFPNSASEPEGNFIRATDNGYNFLKNETSEEHFYQFNPSPGSEGAHVKAGVWNRRKAEEIAAKGQSKETKKSCCKNSANKVRNSSGFSKGKYGESTSTEDGDNQKTESESVDGRQRAESRDSYFGGFSLALERSVEAEKENASAETESDFECGSGLEQVPTRLKKKGLKKKPDNSNSPVP